MNSLLWESVMCWPRMARSRPETRRLNPTRRDHQANSAEGKPNGQPDTSAPTGLSPTDTQAPVAPTLTLSDAELSS